MRTIRELTQQFTLDPEKGLSPQAIADSAKRYGHNRLTPLPREPLWKKFLEKFDEPIIKILLGAALLSMIVNLFQADKTLGGLGIGLVVVAVAGAFVARRQELIPAILFGSAIVLFFLGLF